MSREHSDDYYYRESKRLRAEVLQLADTLKGQPIRIVVENGITMEVEITKSDLRTIVSKASRDNKFNAIKNALLFSSYKIGYMGTSNGFMTTEQLAQWRNLIWGIRDNGL